MWPRASAVGERLWSSADTTDVNDAGTRLHQVSDSHECDMCDVSCVRCQVSCGTFDPRVGVCEGAHG